MAAQDVINYQAAQAAYFANADYDETGDLTKARAFRTALRRLIGLRPAKSRHGDSGGEEIQFDLKTLNDQLKQVGQFISGVVSADSQFQVVEFCRE